MLDEIGRGAGGLVEQLTSPAGLTVIAIGAAIVIAVLWLDHRRK